jgi:hypothetical protein
VVFSEHILSSFPWDPVLLWNTSTHSGQPGVLRRFKLRFFTPGPIHRISSRDGCYLAMGCLPLNITNIYFILRVQRLRAGHYRSGAWIKGGRRGLFRIDELGASDSWLTCLFESYCDLIGHLASAGVRDRIIVDAYLAWATHILTIGPKYQCMNITS